MTPDMLEAAGLMIYGPDWKEPLARDLGVPVRAVRRWHSGYHRISPGIAEEIACLLIDYSDEVNLLAKQIRASVKQAKKEES